MPSNYMVIKALKSYQGDRFSVEAGELKRIRFGYDKPESVPRQVAQARAGEQINRGGATALKGGYAIQFDGLSPLPPELQHPASVNF